MSAFSPSRRGVVLLLTLLLLAILAAAAAELALLSSIDATTSFREGNDLQHRLAVDSVLEWMAAESAEDDRLNRELDRTGSVQRSWQLGDCHILCRIADDGAKLDVRALPDERTLSRRLRACMTQVDLPRCRIRPRPAEDASGNEADYLWFDQLFDELPAAALFGAGTVTAGPPGAEGPVWSDVVTVFGQGRIDLRRTPAEVLEIALGDIDRGLGRKLCAARDRLSGSESSPLAAALATLDGSVRQQAAARLAYDLHRYALTIETAIGADRRRWFVVATIVEGKHSVHYRGAIRW